MSFNEYVAKINSGVIANSSASGFANQQKQLMQQFGQIPQSMNYNEDRHDDLVKKGLFRGYDEAAMMDQRALQQTTSQKWGNAWGKMGVLTGTTFLDATIGSLWGIGESLIAGDASKFWDNKASNFFSSVNDWSEDAMPLYQTTKEENTPWYQRMTTPGMLANFWGDTVFKNFGFTIGAIMGGAAIAGSASKSLGNIFSKKIAGELGKSLVKNSDDVAKIIGKYGAKNADDLILMAGKDPMIASQILQEIQQSAKVIKNINTASSALGLVGSAVGEGRIEAINGKNLMFDKLILEGYAPEEAERLAIGAGNIQFVANVALLSLSNYAQFGKMFGFGNRSAAQAAVKGNFKEAKDFFVKEASKKSLAARVFINPIIESNEEMSQAWAEDFSHDITLRRNDKEAQGFVDDIIASGMKSFTSSYGNIDRWEEGFAGFITGMVGLPNVGGIRNKMKGGQGSVWAGGIAGTLMDNTSNNKQAAVYADTLNSIKNSDAFQVYYKKAVVNASYEQDKENAIEASDTNAYDNLNTEQFINDVGSVVAAGKYDSFMESLEENKQLTGKDIRMALMINKDKNGENLAEPIDTFKNKTDKEIENSNLKNIEYLSKKAEQTRDLKEQLDEKLAYMGLSNTSDLADMLLIDGVMLEETNNKALKLAQLISEEINTMFTAKVNKNTVEGAKHHSASMLTVDDLRQTFRLSIPETILKEKDIIKRNQLLTEFLNNKESKAIAFTSNLEKLVESKFGENVKFKNIDKKKKADLTVEEQLAVFLRDNYALAINEFTNKKSTNATLVTDLIKTEVTRERFVKNYKKLNENLELADKNITKEKQKIDELGSTENFVTTSKKEKAILDKHEEINLKIDSKDFNRGIILIKSTLSKLKELKTNPSIASNISKLENQLKALEDLKVTKQEDSNNNKKKPVIVGVSSLTEIYDKYLTPEQKAEKEELIKDLTDKNIKAAFVIEIEDNAVEGNKAPFEHPLVNITKGNRTGKSVNVYLDMNKLAGKDKRKILLGSLLDPNRFVNKKGEILNLADPSILNRLSNGLVENGELTSKGTYFVGTYLGLQAAWEELRTTGKYKGFLNINKKPGFTIKEESEKITNLYNAKNHGVDFGFGNALYISDKYNVFIFKITEDGKNIKLDPNNDLAEIEAYKQYLQNNRVSATQTISENKETVGYPYTMVVQNGTNHVLVGIQFPKAAESEIDMANLDVRINEVFDNKLTGNDLPVTINGKHLSFFVGNKEDKSDNFNIFVHLDTANGVDSDGNVQEEILTFNVSVKKDKENRNRVWDYKDPISKKTIKLVAIRTADGIKYYKVNNTVLWDFKSKKNNPPAKIKETILLEGGKQTSYLVEEISPIEVIGVLQDFIKGTEMHEKGEFTIGDAILEVDKTDNIDDFQTKVVVFTDLIVHPTAAMVKKGATIKPVIKASITKTKDVQDDDSENAPHNALFDSYVNKAMGISKAIKAGATESFEKEAADKFLDLLEFTKLALNAERNYNNTAKEIEDALDTIENWLNTREGTAEKVSKNKRVSKITKSKKNNTEEGSAIGNVDLANKKDTEDSKNSKNKIDPKKDPFDAPFTFDEYGEIESFEEAEARLKEILSVPVQRIKNIIANGNALGVFFNSAIGLKDRIGKSVKYHEAFHAVFRMYLDNTEINKYLKLAKEKYAKPTQEELDRLGKLIRTELKKDHGLSKEELEDLWYEEKMADEFSNYSVKKDNATGLQKLFNLLLDFIDKFLNSDLETLFKEIYEGKFKTALQKNNSLKRNNPAFKVLSYKDGDSFKFLNNKLTSIIIGNIAENIFNRNKTVYDDKVFEIAMQKTLDSLDPNQYAADVDAFELLGAINKFDNIRVVVENNIEELQKEVQSRLNLYSIEAIKENEDIEEVLEGIEENSDFSRFSKSIWETGGWATNSKRIKSYFGFTKVYTDIYNLNIPNKPEYYLNADPIAFYQYLERNLANTKYEEVFKKIQDMAAVDQDIAAMYKKMVNDIAKESGLERIFVNDLLYRGEYESLIDSPLFNDMLNSFYKIKGNFYISQLDANTGETTFFNANENGADKTIVQNWANAFSNLDIKAKNKKKYLIGIIDTISSNLIVDKNLDSPTAFNQKADILHNLFKELGVTLSRDYIIWNLLHYNKDLNYLPEFYNAYSTAEPFTNIGGNNLFITLSSFIRNYYDEKDSLGLFSTKAIKDKEESVISIFRKVAKNTILFDKSVTESTFTNGENKQIFDKIYPSYLFETLNYYSKLTVSELESLKNIIHTQDRKSLVLFYKKSLNRYIGNYESIMLLEMLTSNPMFEEDAHFLQFKFSNMQHAIHDAFKEKDAKNLFKRTNIAKSFKKLDNIATELFSMGAYSQEENRVYIDRNKKPHNIKFSWIHLGQNEGKSTTISVLMPIINGISNLKEGTAIEDLNSLFGHEIRSINRVKQEIKEINDNGVQAFIASGKNYSEAYHGKIEDGKIKESTSRGLKAFNMPAIFEQLSSDYNLTDLLDNGNTVEQELTNFLENEFNLYKEFLTENNLLTGTKSDYIPGYFRGDNKEINISKLKDYFINDYLNTFKMNLIFHGNFAANFKSYDDVIKRNARIIANGPSVRRKKIKLAILKSKKELISEFESYRTGVDKGVIDSDENKEIDSTDGQTIGTTQFTIHYLKSMGKVTKEVSDILSKIERGIDLIEPVTESELKILEKNNATLQPKKIVQGDMFSYIKTSLHTLTFSQVAKLRAEYNNSSDGLTAISVINRAFKFGDYNQLFEEIFEPIEGKEELFALLQEMYTNKVDIVAFDSAVKTFKSNVNDNLELESTIYGMDNSSYYINYIQFIDGNTMREQVNTDGFKEEVPHGVQLQQLISSEQLALVAYFMDNKLDMDQLVDAYQSLLMSRIENGLEKKLLPRLFTLAPNGKLSETAWDDLMAYMKSAVSDSSDDPYINILFSDLQDREPEFSLDFPVIQRKFQALYLAYVSKKVLTHKVKGNKYTLVSDYGINLPRYTIKIADSLGQLDLTNISSEELSTYIQSKNNSGIYKVLDSAEGSTGVVQHRLRHRVWDKQAKHYYSEAIVSEKVLNKLKLKKGDIIRPELLKQLGLRIPTQDKHSMVVLKIVGTVPGYMGNIIHLPYEIIKLSGADFDVDALYSRAFYYFQNENQSQVIFGDYLESKTPNETAYEEFLMSFHTDNSKYGKYAESYSKYKTEAQNFAKIKEFALANNFLSFDEFVKKYGKQIKNNVKKSKLSPKEINPLTLEETNNLLLRLEMQFVNNDGNKDIAATPASMATIKATNDLFSKIEKLTNVFSRHNKVNSKKTIQTGQNNIGPSAVFNTLFQQLVKYNIETESYFGLSSFKSFLGETGDRINNMISEIISSMVDNAKEQDAAKYNLTLETMTPVLTLIGIGMDPERVLLLAKQPAVKFIIKYFDFESSPLNNNIKKEMKKVKNDKNKLLNYLLTEFKKENNLDPDLKIDSTMPSNEVLIENTIKVTNYASQLFILSEFVRLVDYSKQLVSATRLTGLTKGFKSSFDEVTVEEDLKNLKLKIVGEGHKIKNYEIVNSSDSASDFLPLFKDSLLKTKVIAGHIMIKVSDSFFLSLSSPYVEIQKEMAKGLKANSLEYKDTKYAINEAIVARLMTYIHNSPIDPSILFDESIFEAYKNLKKYFPENKFIQDLILEDIEFKKTNGRVFKNLKVNSWVSSNPSYIAEMLSSFEELYNMLNEKGNFTNLTLLMRYLTARNGLTFQNGSFIKFISPTKFKPYHKRLKSIRLNMSELNYDESKVEEIIGMSLNQFKYESSYIFSVDKQNEFLLAFNNTDKNPISSSLENPVVRTKDKEIVTLNSSYTIDFNKKASETEEEKNKRIAEAKSDNFNKIQFYTNVDTSIVNKRKKLNNPAIIKLGKSSLYKLVRTSEYVSKTDGGPAFLVRDFVSKTQITYKSKDSTSIEIIIATGKIIKEEALDYVMTSDLSEYKKVNSFNYGSVINPYAWAVEDVEFYAKPLVEKETEEEENTSTFSTKLEGMSLGLDLNIDYIEPKESKNKPIESKSFINQITKQERIKIILLINNANVNEKISYEDAFEIFAVEGMVALKERIENCK